MTIPLENLFTLTGRDSQSALWSPFFLRFFGQLASPTIVVGDGQDAPVVAFGVPGASSIPAGYLFWVQALSMRSDPGVGQAHQSLAAVIQNQNGNTIGGLASGGPGNANSAVNEGFSVNFGPDVALLSGVHFLQVIGRFDTGVAVNSVTLDLSGFITVRGNVSL
ncbi:MAG: hypothetical protein ACE5H7_17855 [Acidiferrobacterales bacterium]